MKQREYNLYIFLYLPLHAFFYKNNIYKNS